MLGLFDSLSGESKKRKPLREEWFTFFIYTYLAPPGGTTGSLKIKNIRVSGYTENRPKILGQRKFQVHD